MPAQIPASELSKLPYLRVSELGGRQLGLTPYWDGVEWHSWIPKPDGTLFRMRPRDMGEGTYVASEAAVAVDLHFPFVEFVWKRASWPDVMHWYGALLEDVHQIATSVAKVDFFWSTRERVSALGVRRFVVSELEYLLMICRSLFDELQEIIRAIWRRVRLLDEEQQRTKRDLRGSFADMVIRDQTLMTADDIMRTRRVPRQLAAAYATSGPFLKLLKDLRDGIIHGGKDAPTVLVTERGFVVPTNDKALSSLPMWRIEHAFNDHTVSLRPAIAHVVTTTLATCNAFADALVSMFAFPPDIAPEHRLFIRCQHGEALLTMQDVLEDGSPWWDSTT